MAAVEQLPRLRQALQRGHQRSVGASLTRALDQTRGGAEAQGRDARGGDGDAVVESGGVAEAALDAEVEDQGGRLVDAAGAGGDVSLRPRASGPAEGAVHESRHRVVLQTAVPARRRPAERALAHRAPRHVHRAAHARDVRVLLRA